MATIVKRLPQDRRHRFFFFYYRKTCVRPQVGAVVIETEANPRRERKRKSNVGKKMNAGAQIRNRAPEREGKKIGDKKKSRRKKSHQESKTRPYSEKSMTAEKKTGILRGKPRVMKTDSGKKKSFGKYFSRPIFSGIVIYHRTVMRAVNLPHGCKEEGCEERRKEEEEIIFAKSV